MGADDRISVAILYRHQLFGDGIAHLLACDPELNVESVSLADSNPADVARGLEPAPDVIVFERGDPDVAVEVLRSMPDALVIDVAIGPGPTFAWRRELLGSRPEGIVEAIRRLAGRWSGSGTEDGSADATPAGGVPVASTV